MSKYLWGSIGWFNMSPNEVKDMQTMNPIQNTFGSHVIGWFKPKDQENSDHDNFPAHCYAPGGEKAKVHIQMVN